MIAINQRKYKEALKWIVDILRKNKIKFNILGGLAAYAYGSKRMLFDIDLSMRYKDMKKLSKIVRGYLIEEPWRGISSTKLWKGGYMELNYKGIAIEIGESRNTKFFNKKLKKWENFPDSLSQSVNKKIFGRILPIMPKKNLIDYKSKLRRNIDIIDLENLNR